MAEGVPDHLQVTQEAALDRTAAAAEENPDRDRLTAAAETDSRGFSEDGATVCLSYSITVRAHKSLYN